MTDRELLEMREAFEMAAMGSGYFCFIGGAIGYIHSGVGRKRDVNAEAAFNESWFMWQEAWAGGVRAAAAIGEKMP